MPELYPEDQEKVNAYLASEGRGHERKPFNAWILLLVCLLVLGLLTAVSWFIAIDHGVV